VTGQTGISAALTSLSSESTLINQPVDSNDQQAVLNAAPKAARFQQQEHPGVRSPPPVQDQCRPLPACELARRGSFKRTTSTDPAAQRPALQANVYQHPAAALPTVPITSFKQTDDPWTVLIAQTPGIANSVSAQFRVAAAELPTPTDSPARRLLDSNGKTHRANHRDNFGAVAARTDFWRNWVRVPHRRIDQSIGTGVRRIA